MTDRCFGFEELDEILRRGAGDRRREHVDRCPRCRSRLVLYQSYVVLHEEAGGPAEDSDPGEIAAAEQLRGVLERNILGPSRGVIAARADRSRSRWLSRLFGPLLRRRRLAPALGFATLLIAGVLFIRTWEPWTDRGIVFRDAGDPSPPRDIALSPPVLMHEGGLELRWKSVPGADTYRVRLLGSGFEELARFDAGPDTLLLLTVGEIQQLSDPPSVSFWLVEGLSFGDRIAESAPAILILPSP